VGALAAGPVALRPADPAPLPPRRLPGQVRCRCARPRLVSRPALRGPWSRSAGAPVAPVARSATTTPRRSPRSRSEDRPGAATEASGYPDQPARRRGTSAPIPRRTWSNSAGSRNDQFAQTTLSSELPAASSPAFTLRRHWRVCSLIAADDLTGIRIAGEPREASAPKECRRLARQEQRGVNGLWCQLSTARVPAVNGPCSHRRGPARQRVAGRRPCGSRHVHARHRRESRASSTRAVLVPCYAEPV
jgi:hypothetical protein